MDLKKQISDDMKAALKLRNQVVVDALRMILSAIKNREIDKRGELDEAELISVISGMVKQGREAADLYRRGCREDLADKEEKEIALLKSYLPEEMESGEIVKIIDDALQESGASSLADMGRVMKVVMPKVAGRAEGRIVSDLVRERLLA